MSGNLPESGPAGAETEAIPPQTWIWGFRTAGNRPRRSQTRSKSEVPQLTFGNARNQQAWRRVPESNRSARICNPKRRQAKTEARGCKAPPDKKRKFQARFRQSKMKKTRSQRQL